MGCCGRKSKQREVKAEQRWDYINLSDFKSTSFWAPCTYGILYISLLISITVYCVDVWTAINLLAFRRWSSSVQPVFLNYTRWVFAGCIILSFANLASEWIRAVRVMKRGGVAESYLDPLAVRVQSIRIGKNGRGWRRFLVFAELTKSKQGVEYVALFAYFSFKAWVRILLCEGPRNVINAATLYTVFMKNLNPATHHHGGYGPFIQFWKNIGFLAQNSRKEAIILSGMAYVLVIWIVTLLNLMVACLMYIFFLWHYIPTADNGLSGYLQRKIDGRVNKIVAVKTKKTLEKEMQKMKILEAKAIKAGARVSQVKRQPTLPMLSNADDGVVGSQRTIGSDRQPTLPSIPLSYLSQPPSRSGTSSAPDDWREPTLPHMVLGGHGTRPDPPSRSVTNSSMDSTRSTGSNAPLIGRVHGRVDDFYAAGRGALPPLNITMGNSRANGTPGFGAFGEMDRTMTPVSQGSTPISRRASPFANPTPRQHPTYGGPGFRNESARRGPTPGPMGRGRPRQQDFGPPRQQDFGPPRQQDFGPPRQQDFGPPRQQDFGPPRQQDFGPPRQQDFGPPRQQDFGPPRQQDSRGQNPMPPQQFRNRGPPYLQDPRSQALPAPDFRARGPLPPQNLYFKGPAAQQDFRIQDPASRQGGPDRSHHAGRDF